MLDQAADYSRLNHPDFHLNASCLDLSAFLRDYAAGLQKELDQAGYPLHKKIEEKEVLVKFDRLQMKRVLENIIANTLRYTPKGTEVTLQMTADKDSARILIGDNGPGIPAKIRDHVFEPFVIADEARTAGSGCGLGLSIARKIIEEHHGTMKLLKQSGTVYEIVLPLAEKEST
jgi:signal transduction histidine kinase